VWESGYTDPRILTSAPDGEEWSASRPGTPTTGETAHSTRRTEDWVSSTDGLGAVKKKKIYCPCMKSNPDFSLSYYIDWATPAPSQCLRPVLTLHVAGKCAGRPSKSAPQSLSPVIGVPKTCNPTGPGLQCNTTLRTDTPYYYRHHTVWSSSQQQNLHTLGLCCMSATKGFSGGGGFS
jgi:hypothetical protein